METASLKQIKSQLELQSHDDLVDICLRLGKFKTDNKDLLTYLLFEATDEENYIKSVKIKLDDLFDNVNVAQLYIAKKNLRKIIRTVNKYTRYTNNIETEILLLIHVFDRFSSLGIDFKKSKVIDNMRAVVQKKADKLINNLHEDLQYDFRKLLSSVEN